MTARSRFLPSTVLCEALRVNLSAQPSGHSVDAVREAVAIRLERMLATLGFAASAVPTKQVVLFEAGEPTQSLIEATQARIPAPKAIVLNILAELRCYLKGNAVRGQWGYVRHEANRTIVLVGAASTQPLPGPASGRGNVLDFR